jgi:hypothetical protein
MAFFEAEIRRRLWWQILIVEGRSALLSGVTTEGAFGNSWDTKRPLNINDSDLSPLMREPPAEHTGVTEMLFCTVRFDVGETMRKLKVGERNGMTLEGKKLVIDELEAKLEPRISKCDPSIPLHLLAMFMGKSTLAQLRLLAANPLRTCGDTSLARAPIPQEERDRQFELALQILSYDSLAHSNQAIRPFLWHVDLQFPFESFILVLAELLSRTKGEDADRAWLRVNQAYEDHPELVSTTRNPLYVAMGNLAVRAWEWRMMGVERERLDVHPVESHAIARLREQRERKRQPLKEKVQGAGQNMNGFNIAEDAAGADVDDIGMDGFEMFSMDVEQLGWNDWQGLLQGGDSERGFMR